MKRIILIMLITKVMIKRIRMILIDLNMIWIIVMDIDNEINRNER